MIMYGLINKAVQGYLVQAYGQDQWDQIAETAGIYPGGFISLETYPDEITYSLVTRASAILSIPSERLLEKLGEYWIEYVAEEGYGEYFVCYDQDMVRFLQELNAMHERMMLIHPQMLIPKFQIQKISAGNYALHYFSTRQGLAPFVKGLLLGLSRKLNQAADIEHIGGCSDSAGVHEIYRISLLTA